MTSPHVIELPRRMEPVGRDTFLGTTEPRERAVVIPLRPRGAAAPLRPRAPQPPRAAA